MRENKGNPVGPFIHIKDAGHNYGDFKAIERVDVAINEFEFVCIIGPSGCGKSTLLNILSGLMPPTKGQVIVSGREIYGQGAKPDVGYVFQEPRLLNWRTVRQNILIALRSSNIPRERWEEQTRRYLEIVGLLNFSMNGGITKDWHPKRPLIEILRLRLRMTQRKGFRIAACHECRTIRNVTPTLSIAKVKGLSYLKKPRGVVKMREGAGALPLNANFLRFLSFLTIIGIWWILSFFYTPKFLPGPALVGFYVLQDLISPNTYTHISYTLYRIVVSFLISFSLGTALGIVMGTRKKAELFFDIWVMVGLTIPAPAWAIIAVMLFGLKEGGAIFAIVLLAAPFITVNVWQGAKNLDMQLIEMGHAFKFGYPTLFRDIVIPQLVPFLLAAARYGFGLCWKVVVIVEMIALGDGVGRELDRHFHSFEMYQVLAWTVIFTGLMMSLEWSILKNIERRLVRWRPIVKL